MAVAVVSSEFAHHDEIWTVYHDAENIKKGITDLAVDMNRLVLFTLGASYIATMALYAQRLTLVRASNGQLMGFAIMNLETFQMPEWASEWDGTDRLTQNSESLRGVPKKRGDKKPVVIAHLGALGCGPLVVKGLGGRILNFQKAMVASMGLSFLAIEAIKPLDTDYYGPRGFQTTTPTFYPTSGPTLVPMFCKITAEDLPKGPIGPIELADIATPSVAITTKEREAIAAPTDLWPAGDERHQFFMTECPVLVSAIYSYMWHLRDDDAAIEALRRLTVRTSLEPKETLKLWSMRFHSQKRLADKKSLPISSSDWFKGPAVAVSEGQKDLIRAKYTALKKNL